MSDESLNNNFSLVSFHHASDELFTLEQPYLQRFAKNNYHNPSLTLHTSMVYGFAYHLPYSMDIEQEEYVPGDFLNLEPFDVDTNDWFKWDDRRSIYNAMVRWGDTFKSGVLLEICYIFQQMLLGNLPHTSSLTDDDYLRLGISDFSDDKEYNQKFFHVLQKLPIYYDKVVFSDNREERRKNLQEVYDDICEEIELRVGTFREYNPDGTIKKEHKGTVSNPAYRDVEMLVYWQRVTYFDGLKFDLTKQIKERQLKQFEKQIKAGK